MDESPLRHALPSIFGAWGRSGSLWDRTRAALTIAFAAVLVGALHRADLPSALSLIVRAPGVWLAALPAALAVLCDGFGWKRLFLGSGAPLPFRVLIETRLASEAVALSLPTGTVFGEATALLLLHRWRGVSLARAGASLASRRLFVTFAHGLSLGAAGIAGLFVLRRVWPAGWAALAWASPVASVTLVSVTLIAPALLVRGSLARRFPRFSHYLRRSGTPATRPLSAATAAYILMWALESVESAVILNALGADLGWAQVFAFDQLLTLVRSLAFFAPAGLGVQDLGYIVLLSALVPDAAGLGAAFVLAKRVREALFVVLGYGVLLSRTSAAPAATVGEWSPS
jgi:uncharacterized membrane protein YbhN (UPF0104 family)